MKMYLIDTNIFIRLFKGDIRAQELLHATTLSASCISVFTIAEILIGCKSVNQKKKALAFFKKFKQLPITTKIVPTAVEIIHIFPDYFEKKIGRTSVDAFIAASAIHHNLVLISLNRRHFQKLKRIDLKCIILKETDKKWNLIQ